MYVCTCSTIDVRSLLGIISVIWGKPVSECCPENVHTVCPDISIHLQKCTYIHTYLHTCVYSCVEYLLAYMWTGFSMLCTYVCTYVIVSGFFLGAREV